jgi:hypothetical protein
MELHREFAEMAQYISKNVVPRTYAQQLVRDLAHFEKLARENPSLAHGQNIAIRWNTFVIQLNGTQLLNRLKANAHNWTTVENFLAGRPPIERKIIVPSPPKPLDWDAEKFFRHLFSEAAVKPQLTGKDRQLVLIGLKYLITESEKPKIKRDRKWIGETWTTIHPLIEAIGLLEQFKFEKLVRDRVRAFVRGSI